MWTRKPTWKPGHPENGFDRIPEQDPDLYAFLTELVADRFDRSGPIAERHIGPYLITGIIGKAGTASCTSGSPGPGTPVAVKCCATICP